MMRQFGEVMGEIGVGQYTKDPRDGVAVAVGDLDRYAVSRVLVGLSDLGFAEQGVHLIIAALLLDTCIKKQSRAIF